MIENQITVPVRPSFEKLDEKRFGLVIELYWRYFFANQPYNPNEQNIIDIFSIAKIFDSKTNSRLRKRWEAVFRKTNSIFEVDFGSGSNPIFWVGDKTYVGYNKRQGVNVEYNRDDITSFIGRYNEFY